MGGIPGNPAPRNHFLVRIVKPSSCHSTDAFGGNKYRRVTTPLRSTSPVSDKSTLHPCPLEQHFGGPVLLRVLIRSPMRYNLDCEFRDAMLDNNSSATPY